MATRLTGAPVASKIYAQVREKAAALGTQPCLAAVSVGAQPDDRAYLRSIARSADGCGVACRRRCAHSTCSTRSTHARMLTA